MFRIDRWILLLVLALALPASAAQPIVFCWNALTNQPGLSPMTTIDCTKSTTLAVSQIAAGFARLPQSQRAVYLWGCLQTTPIFVAGNIQNLVENGPNCSAEQQYLQALFTQMKARGLIPARFILDLEGGINTWSLTPSNAPLSSVLMPIYENSAAFQKLPTSLQKYTPSDFDNYASNPGHPATVAWNAWTNAMIDQALRQTVSVTATKIFGINIPATNYQDILPSFTVYDFNNWPLSSSAMGSETSFALYLTVDGNRYTNCQKDVRWNHFIDALNQTRSALPNGPVVPWVSYPTHGGDSLPHGGCPWLWRELIRHLNQMGVTQYLLFNPSNGALLSDDQYASQVFRSMQTMTPTTKVYQPIPLDANSVTTGTVTTTYSDFLANLLGGAGAVLK